MNRDGDKERATEEKRKNTDEEEEEEEEEVDERTLRIFACDLIQNAGILLKLPQVALATAQMLLQRAYHTTEYTFDKQHLDITAMACLFLAAKIEEYQRRAHEVIDVFNYVISSKLHRDHRLNSSRHQRVREKLIMAEKRLLKTLGFSSLSSYPHKMIVTFYHCIVNKLDPELDVWTERTRQRVIQLAWNYCNDSLRLDLFNNQSQEVVACACIQLACEREALGLLPTSTDGRQWYCLFVTNEQEVLESMRVISSLYERERIEPTKMRRFLYLEKI